MSAPRNLAHTANEDGSIVDAQGCHWDGVQGYLQGYVLNFCCCGRPEENLAYVRAGLHWRAAWATLPWDADWHTALAAHQQQGLALFGNENALAFFLYWASETEPALLEHGSSIGGSWLTPYGVEVLALLDTWYATLSHEDRKGLAS